MSASNAIRGSRVGSSPVRWAESPTDRSETVARRTIGYWCANGHHTEQTFAAEVEPPAGREPGRGRTLRLLQGAPALRFTHRGHRTGETVVIRGRSPVTRRTF